MNEIKATMFGREKKVINLWDLCCWVNAKREEKEEGKRRWILPIEQSQTLS